MGRPKSANPRVFCAYRLPSATPELIASIAAEMTREAGGKKVSEANVVALAVSSYQSVRKPALQELERLAAIVAGSAFAPPAPPSAKPAKSDREARLAEMHRLARAAEGPNPTRLSSLRVGRAPLLKPGAKSL